MVWVSFHVAISCIISRGSLRCYVEKDSGAEKERVGDHLAIAVMAWVGKGGGSGQEAPWLFLD